MARQFNPFSGQHSREVDLSKQNYSQAGIGSISGALFGAATGFITTGGNPMGALIGAGVGAVSGASPGLTKEATEYFYPVGQSYKSGFGDLHKGAISTPGPQQTLSPQSIPTYMSGLDQSYQGAQQYSPAYMSKMQRYAKT